MNSRKNSTVVSHNDFIQDRTDNTPVHINLFGSRTKNLQNQSPKLKQYIRPIYDMRPDHHHKNRNLLKPYVPFLTESVGMIDPCAIQ